MKYLFFVMCIVCAITLSLLAVIFKTGRVPFHPAPAPVTVKSEEEKPAESLTVFTDSGKAVEELIAALKNERAQYEKKMAELTAREEEAKTQEALLNRLKTELIELQGQLNENVTKMEEAEKANLRRLADVCGKMDSASAASSLLQMEKERAAMILSLMNERQAAGILDATVSQSAKGAETVAEWTDIMRRLERENSKAKAKKGV
jgi:flagellar motility protein MotE (MotC chaperone)